MVIYSYYKVKYYVYRKYLQYINQKCVWVCACYGGQTSFYLKSDVDTDTQCKFMAFSIITLVMWSCLCFCAGKWFLWFSYSWQSELLITWWLVSHRWRDSERVLDTNSTSAKLQAIKTLIYFKQTSNSPPPLYELFWVRQRLVQDQFSRFVVCVLTLFCIRNLKYNIYVSFAVGWYVSYSSSNFHSLIKSASNEYAMSFN